MPAGKPEPPLRAQHRAAKRNVIYGQTTQIRRCDKWPCQETRDTQSYRYGIQILARVPQRIQTVGQVEVAADTDHGQ